MTYLLDTDVFLRVFVREDENDFETCKRLLERVKTLKLSAVTAGIVLAELGWMLSSYYRTKRSEAAEKVLSVVRLGGLRVVDTYDWIEAMETYRRNNVKLVDAVLATIPEVAKKTWTIVSLDQDFKKLPVKWVRPTDVLE